MSGPLSLKLIPLTEETWKELSGQGGEMVITLLLHYPLPSSVKCFKHIFVVRQIRIQIMAITVISKMNSLEVFQRGNLIQRI